MIIKFVQNTLYKMKHDLRQNITVSNRLHIRYVKCTYKLRHYHKAITYNNSNNFKNIKNLNVQRTKGSSIPNGCMERNEIMNKHRATARVLWQTIIRYFRIHTYRWRIIC